ncbi:hypothetical protein [Algoriphagus persicinus]|uniref:hypothetical protein n=1 Tax=Algoriphagus persicinus TaxID=3108754 RepID=UPI002B399FEE|nr:hypothetical protein [Algoriphagus sp. E1-3-M2]MEB2786505.1 hypothetical protein [Algoriphagus sp. E1-3-M2]
MTEKEELIERALSRVLEGGEDNFKLAIWDLKRAKDERIPWVGGSDPNYPLDRKSDFLRYLIEILSGLEASKQELFKFIIDGARVKKIDEYDSTEIKNLKEVHLNTFSEKFLGSKLPDLWLKSLKYDAILRELERSEEIKNKSQLEKIKSIIGEI